MLKPKRGFPCLIALTALTVLCAVLGLCLGSARLSLLQVLSGLGDRDGSTVEAQIIWVVRLPHVAACLLAGAGLAVSGVLLQTATGNSLAGPNVIGVNAGAGFALMLCMCFFPMAYHLQPLAAFIGAFVCTLLIVAVASKAGGARVTIVLSGVAVSSLLSAGMSLMRMLQPDLSIAYSAFSIGGVSGVAFDELTVPALLILACLLCAQLAAGRLNLLCLGDAIAHALGVRVKRLRMLALLLASASAAAAVCFAGLMGFVGLMVPHIARRLTKGGDVRRLLPASALLGASLVTLADVLGRVLAAPSEIPAGVITAFIGAPFFFSLLTQRRNRL